MRALFEKISFFFVGNHTSSDSFWVTRKILIRCLGFIYLISSSILFFQAPALWGKTGLLPIENAVQEALQTGGSIWDLMFRFPSLFYFVPADLGLKVFPLISIFGSLALLFGIACFPILFILWMIQLSFVNTGQLFYGYGWETQLLEFTFYSFFLVPFFDPRKLNTTAAPRIVFWAYRWMLFRLMLGAGLIKIRGDECWRDLSCLLYHYETQPNPHPLSWIYHQMPAPFHYAGTLFNHFVELIVPFGFFFKKTRRIAGVLTVIFQCIIISSGNLSWLNWLTLIMCIPCFDDEILEKILKKLKPNLISPRPTLGKSHYGQILGLGFFSILVLFLSIPPGLNLISANQMMNTSYDGWHLVNSYGAFGSIGKKRYEIIIQGSEQPRGAPNPVWKEYEFKCKPGDITRRPCLITPYHYHLDWQIWFSAMRPVLQEEWLLRFAVRLLESDPLALSLLESFPAENGKIRQIKMDLYRYQFSDWKDWPANWWKREFVQEYLPPISLDMEQLKPFKKSEK